MNNLKIARAANEEWLTARSIKNHNRIEKSTAQTDEMEEGQIHYNIPVSNSWGILEEDECEEMEAEKPSETDKSTKEKPNENNKKPPPPPIVITMAISEYKSFNNKIRETVGSDNYTIIYATKASRIFLKDEETYNRVQEALKRDGVAYHSYTKREERPKKFY